MHKQVLSPIWTYDIQLWTFRVVPARETSGCFRCQNKVLRNVVNGPWFVRNSVFHRTWIWRLSSMKSGDLYVSMRRTTISIITVTPYSCEDSSGRSSLDWHKHCQYKIRSAVHIRIMHVRSYSNLFRLNS